jgi:predicted  nucleic acid-binding Zn-ribbon protein
MIINSKELISKYNDQLKKIRNNREFDSLNKEIEFQDLEIQLSEKKIKEFKLKVEEINALISEVTEKLKERKEDLKIKNGELDKIISETKKDEEKLLKESSKAEKVIDDRLLTAYSRLRKNFKNGLAVVKVNRNACGGCFNTVPPQRQMDIASHKKIIVCEHCGRILIDEAIAGK